MRLQIRYAQIRRSSSSADVFKSHAGSVHVKRRVYCCDQSNQQGKIDGYLIGQEPVFSGPRFDQMAAVYYSQWLEALARLRGVMDAEIPSFMISQLQSSAGSADKITAVMLSQYGHKVSAVATPAQRQGMLSTLTSPQRSQALMSDPSTDLRAIAIQMLNK